MQIFKRNLRMFVNPNFIIIVKIIQLKLDLQTALIAYFKALTIETNTLRLSSPPTKVLESGKNRERLDIDNSYARSITGSFHHF